MNQFYTHQQFLREILNSFNYEKNVTCLEFGSGDGSSSVFNEFDVESATFTLKVVIP